MTTTRRSSSRLSGLVGGAPSSSSLSSSPKKKKKKSRTMTTSDSPSSALDEENAPIVTRTRRLTRGAAAASVAAAAKKNVKEEEEEETKSDNDDIVEADDDDDGDDNGNDDEDDDAVEEETYIFNGVTYATYQAMVDAKRLRNQQVLAASGLLKAAAAVFPNKTSSSSTTAPSTGNNNKKRRSSSSNTTSTSSSSSSNSDRRRTSKRLAGIESDGTFVDDERGGRFSIASSSSGGDQQHAPAAAPTIITTTDINVNNNNDRRGRGRRINDGSDLSLEQALQLVAPNIKWLEENSVEQARSSLLRDTLQLFPQQQNQLASVSSSTNNKNNSHCSWTRQEMRQQLQERSSMDGGTIVAKVVPDRIYSITTHPSSHHLVVCAGDKQGHVGMWNVDAGASLSATASSATGGTAQNEDTDSSCKTNNKDSPTTVILSALDSNINKSSSSNSNSSSIHNGSNGGIHLFRPHASTTACLEWTRQGTALLSMSYDGTCRLFDVAAERFEQVFDSSCIRSSSNNGGISEASDYFNDGHFWFQYACLDHRNQDCFFLSTSVGTAMHVDMRASGKQRVTFHEEWSEKKINSLSLHPNGYSLLSAGLDTKARLWDLRFLGNSISGRSSCRKGAGVNGQVQVQPVAYYEAGRSINSAFFSPSGKFVVSTTQMDRLDILQDMHLAATSTMTTTSTTLTKTNKETVPIRVEPVQSIRHDNKTGRWLSTFMANWHAVHDVFCVGSMQQPRVMDVFTLDPLNNNNSNSACGDQFGRLAIGGCAVTAVTSRCCFHSRSDQLIVVGGTSSGRVAISR